MKYIYYSLLFIFAFSIQLKAQLRPKYEDDILTIKKYDKMYAPPVRPTIFVGSSSIRRWGDLERTFAAYTAMNRGIGGAVINEITEYVPELIVEYKPKQIVIYVGENDLGEKTTTADSIFHRTKRLISTIRAALPTVPILYISIKPSPARDKMMPIAREANFLISNYLITQPNIRFIDVFHLMITTEGKSRPELFLPDMLHMNTQGYKIWTKAIQPFLIKRKEL